MAVNHQETDRPPRGEILVEEAFLDRYYPEEAQASYIDKMRHLAEESSIDLVTVTIDSEDREKGVKDLGKWAKETPYFLMALVDGLFWREEDPLSFEEFIIGIYSKNDEIRELIEIKKKRALDLIKRCLDEGAHGCMIGDDLAYNKGPFISPEDLQELIFPGLGEMAAIIKKAGGVAFLHSCGNVTTILDLILSSRFDGLHGLAQSAGNDPLVIRQKTRQRLALMGIFEVDRLNPGQIKAMKDGLLSDMAGGGGYILGSSEGISTHTPLDSFRALYCQ